MASEQKPKYVKVVKVTMDRDLYECFLRVKKYIGIESDADVVRFLIKNYYNKLTIDREN
jgi:hypothetical protein